MHLRTRLKEAPSSFRATRDAILSASHVAATALRVLSQAKPCTRTVSFCARRSFELPTTPCPHLHHYKEHALVRNECNAYLTNFTMDGKTMEKLSFSELKTGLGLLAGKYGMTLLTKNLQPPTKKFFSLHTTILAESFEPLNNCLQLSAPELRSRKAMCDPTVLARNA